MLSDILMLLLGALLTIGTAIFVCAEFALVTLDPASVEQKAHSGHKGAKRVSGALHRLSIELSSAQVGITLTTILLGYTAQPALTNLLEQIFGLRGSPFSPSLAAALAVVIAFGIVNAFSMVFGELLPKNAAIAEPLQVAALVTPAQRVFTLVFKPLILLLNNSANLILRQFGIQAAEEISGARSASELAALVRHSAKEGKLDVSVATLLTRSIGLGKITAVDVMTPRGIIVALDREESAADVVRLARETGHSRFLVLGEDLDDVLGIVTLRRAITVPFTRRAEVPVSSQSLLSQVPRLPETVELAPLLVALRDSDTQMAVVVDEYGGTAGLVTLEDAVEEVVGEVADEHDPRSFQYARRADGTWLVEGILRPDEVGWKTGLEIPDDGPYETVGGFVMSALGRIPQVGDRVYTEDLVVTVEAMDGRRVDRVLLERRKQAFNSNSVNVSTVMTEQYCEVTESSVIRQVASGEQIREQVLEGQTGVNNKTESPKRLGIVARLGQRAAAKRKPEIQNDKITEVNKQLEKIQKDRYAEQSIEQKIQVSHKNQEKNL